MVIPYFYTKYRDDDAFSISDTEDVDDDGLDDDVLTKPLPQVEFEHFQDKLGVVRKGLPRKGE